MVLPPNVDESGTNNMDLGEKANGASGRGATDRPSRESGDNVLADRPGNGEADAARVGGGIDPGMGRLTRQGSQRGVSNQLAARPGKGEAGETRVAESKQEARTRACNPEPRTLRVSFEAVKQKICDPESWRCRISGTSESLIICLRDGFICSAQGGVFENAIAHCNELRQRVTRSTSGAECGSFWLEMSKERMGVLDLSSPTPELLTVDVDTPQQEIESLRECLRTMRGDTWDSSQLTLITSRQETASHTEGARTRPEPPLSPGTGGMKRSKLGTLRLISRYFQSMSRHTQDDRLAGALYHWRNTCVGRCFNTWRSALLSLRREEPSAPSTPRRKSMVGVGVHRLGLRNVGNTCYLNSVLQALGHLPAFRDHILTLTSVDGGAEGEGEGELTRELRVVLCCMWDSFNVIYTPDRILKTLWRLFPIFRGFRQQVGRPRPLSTACVWFWVWGSGLKVYGLGRSVGLGHSSLPASMTARSNRVLVGVVECLSSLVGRQRMRFSRHW